MRVGNFKKIGELMNENHRLLQEIEVSSKELDQLVDVSRKQGAYGAKLTGGGGGGCMVALTPGKELQAKVASAIRRSGLRGFDDPNRHRNLSRRAFLSPNSKCGVLTSDFWSI